MRTSHSIAELTSIDGVEEFIRAERTSGVSINKLVAKLNHRFNLTLTYRQLVYYLYKYGIYRPQNSSITAAFRALQLELQVSGEEVGYRTIQNRLCSNHGIRCSRETVRQLLVSMRGSTSLARRRRVRRGKFFCPGPDFIWSFDGHDKIKNYGFFVYGGIDEFSRFIVCLDVHFTNRDLTYIAGLYADTVRRLKRVPRITRTDRGTETIKLAEMQYRLRSEHVDENSNMPHIFCPSTSNIDIESFWSKLLSLVLNYWRNHFRYLSETGKFVPGDIIDQYAMWYIYMPILKEELAHYVNEHNSRRIRRQRTRIRPSDVPKDLYLYPEIYGYRSLSHLITDTQIDQVCDDMNLDENWRKDYIPDFVRIECENFFRLNNLKVSRYSCHACYLILRDYLRLEL